MSACNSVVLNPSVSSCFDFLSERWGLSPVLVDRAELAAKRQINAQISSPVDALCLVRTTSHVSDNLAYLFKNVLVDSAEIWSPPKEKKSNGYKPSKTLYLEDGEWVYACTRGCNQSFRNHICFHGVPFVDRCTEACAECRTPHKEIKFSLSTNRQPSIKGGSCFSTQRGLPRKTRCVRADPFRYQQWEKKLKLEPWSEEIQRGRDQSMRHLRRIWNPPVTVPVASMDEPVSEQPLSRDSERRELDRLGFGGSRMSLKQARIVKRVVPQWMYNDTFVRGVVDRMFPHPHQERKRHTLHWLLMAYFRRMEDVNIICETLGLSQKGLDSKLSRFKERAEKAAASLLIS